MSRIFTMSFASVYPHYLNKVTRKNRTEAELRAVIRWLTGFTDKKLQSLINREVTFTEFFDQATLNPDTKFITGSICGIKVQEIEDPLMQKIRFLDKVVDELAPGKSVERITTRSAK